MRMRFAWLLTVGAAAMAFPLAAADGDFMAETAEAKAFRLNTLDTQPFIISSQEEIDELMPVGWSRGESVTATTPDGSTYQLVPTASSAGAMSISEYLVSGGVWSLYNPAYGTVKAGVSWMIFGGGTLAESPVSPFVMDTFRDGPDRRGSIALPAWPGIAYSGDKWARDGSAGSTLTLVSPDGASVTTNFTGCGALPFAPKKSGRWSATLANASQTLEADILVIGGIVFTVK